MTDALVITVDGPSGAGKGTLCQLLAKHFGFGLLDSGALYRLTALAALQAGTALDNEDELAKEAANLAIEFVVVDGGVRTELAGADVSRAIREERVGMAASKVAAYPKVRAALLDRQRAFSKAPGLVADGRDMGTVVFPKAPVKIFLTASAKARAERRVAQLKAAGVTDINYQKIFDDIVTRDKQDSERALAPLKPAGDAVLIDSTALTIEQVLQEAITLAQSKVQIKGDPSCAQ